MGVVRAKTKIGLKNLVYNMLRLISLIQSGDAGPMLAQNQHYGITNDTGIHRNKVKKQALKERSQYAPMLQSL
jgi:hypothetical protein